MQAPAYSERVNLTPLNPPADKREATKWHNRRSIVDAAAELAADHGVDGFTVSELAEKAGVSRRTIFNHFTNVGDAVFAAFAERISSFYEQVELSLGDARFASLPEAYAVFADALRSVDILGAAHPMLAPLDAADPAPLGDSSEPPNPGEIWVNRIMDGIVRACAESLQNRFGAADPFEIRLLVEVVAASLSACVEQWAATTDGTLSNANREVWVALLDRTLRRLEVGFGHPGAG